MRHKDTGDVDFIVQPAKPHPEFLANARVQSAKGFVQQENLGFDSQRARQSDALPLAAGKLAGIPIRQPVQLDKFQQGQ